MLKLSLKEGQYVNIGDDIRIVFAAKTTIAHSKFRMCIDAKFPHTPICTPKFRNAPKSKVSDYLKRPSKFPPTQ